MFDSRAGEIAHAAGQLSPWVHSCRNPPALEPGPRNERSHRNEKPKLRNEGQLPLVATTEKPVQL